MLGCYSVIISNCCMVMKKLYGKTVNKWILQIKGTVYRKRFAFKVKNTQNKSLPSTEKLITHETSNTT
jgi:hypothetical protein